VPLFDRLDSGESFVNPAQALLTWATDKRIIAAPAFDPGGLKRGAARVRPTR
jgi:hypothetical protein